MEFSVRFRPGVGRTGLAVALQILVVFGPGYGVWRHPPFRLEFENVSIELPYRLSSSQTTIELSS